MSLTCCFALAIRSAERRSAGTPTESDIKVGGGRSGEAVARSRPSDRRTDVDCGGGLEEVVERERGM